MNIYEIMFLIQFIVFIGVFLVKIWNVMRIGDFYSFELVWILLIGAGFTFAIGWIVVMGQPEVLIYQVLFRLQSWIWAPMFMLVIAELMFFLKGRANKTIEAYSSKAAAGVKK